MPARTLVNEIWGAVTHIDGVQVVEPLPTKQLTHQQGVTIRPSDERFPPMTVGPFTWDPIDVVDEQHPWYIKKQELIASGEDIEALLADVPEPQDIQAARESRESLARSIASADWQSFRLGLAASDAFERIVSASPAKFTMLESALNRVIGDPKALSEVVVLWNLIAARSEPTTEEIAAINQVASVAGVPLVLGADGTMSDPMVAAAPSRTWEVDVLDPDGAYTDWLNRYLESVGITETMFASSTGSPRITGPIDDPTMAKYVAAFKEKYPQWEAVTYHEVDDH